MVYEIFNYFVGKTYKMNKNAPEIIALRHQIEKKVGRAINSPSEFEFLSGAVWNQTGERISPTTFKRLWGYIDGTDSTRESTLRILSRFLGYKSFPDFCDSLSEEEVFQSDWIDGPRISASDLKKGDLVEVSWMPNRLCRFRFDGGMRFTVMESQNSKLQVGDRFECSMFIQGAPMYLNNYTRGLQAPVAFVAGLKDGLISIRVLR